MYIFIALLIVGWAIFFFVLTDGKVPKKKNKEVSDDVKSYGITSKKLMTEREKAMFKSMERSLPECYIFSQVCLGAILDAPYQHRGRFAQKMADYVVTDDEFNILAVIELDDRSHIGKEKKDAKRDEMVEAGGHKALRYPNIPPRKELRQDVLGEVYEG
ncbi:MAG: DUF2726 domain-containing protein [Providencia sp.]